MPFGDGTGPMGLGPMTGRAAGYCAGYPVPGFASPMPGLGWGRSFYPYSGYTYPQTGSYGQPYPSPGYMNPGYYGYPYVGSMPYVPYGPFGFGRGFGRGLGRGRGGGRGRWLRGW